MHKAIWIGRALTGRECGIGATTLSAFDKATASYLYPHAVAGLGSEADGTGIAVGYINNNNLPDVIFMANDAPPGPNTFRYRIAYDLNSDGYPASLSQIKYVAGMGDYSEGAGIAYVDIDRNGVKDIVLMAYDAPEGANQFRYKIGYNINANGDASYWSSVKYISGIADKVLGSDIAFGDIDKNGILDVVLMAYDIPSGSTQVRYKIGYNVSTAGDASYWSSVKYSSGFAGIVSGASVDLTDIDNNGTLDIVFFIDDNPDGFNEFRYKIGFNLNSSGDPSYYSNVMSYPGVGEVCQGTGIAFADVDGNGVKDIILMANDNPPGENQFRYRIGFNLDPSGMSTDWR